MTIKKHKKSLFWLLLLLAVVGAGAATTLVASQISLDSPASLPSDI